MRVEDRFLTDESEREAAVRDAERKYGDVFGNGLGVEVLAHMLDALGLFEPVATEEERVRQNYAIELLRWIGITPLNKYGRTANVENLVRKMLTERKVR